MYAIRSYYENIIALGTRSFMETGEKKQTQIYLDGTSNLIKTPEFTDINKMIV